MPLLKLFHHILKYYIIKDIIEAEAEAEIYRRRKLKLKAVKAALNKMYVQ